MNTAADAMLEAINCRIGSLETAVIGGLGDDLINCRIGSLEKTSFLRV